MKYRKLLSVVLAFCLVCSFSACNKKDKSEKEKPAPPAPVEATDENSITFDDGNFKFASILDSDYKAAKGSLSVEEVQGNPMLKFTDSGDSFKNDLIQKIRISMLPIMSPENIAKVDSIEFVGTEEITSIEQSTEPLVYTLGISAFYSPDLIDLENHLPDIETPAPAEKDNPLSIAPDVTKK